MPVLNGSTWANNEQQHRSVRASGRVRERERERQMRCYHS